jgi:hypothetical protein
MQLEAGTVITLPDGVSWLGHSTDFSNQVFVRSAYPEMLRARDAYRAAGRVFKATLITGTPGGLYAPSHTDLMPLDVRAADDWVPLCETRDWQVAPLRAACCADPH